MKLIPFDGAHGTIYINPRAVMSVELEVPNPSLGLSFKEARKLLMVRINTLDGDSHFSAELKPDVANDLRDDFLRRLEAWDLPASARGSMGPCGDEIDDL